MKINWSNHLIELMIVIVGVSIAFWLNERSIDRKEARVRATYLSDIGSDLQDDLKELNYVIQANTKKVENLLAAAKLFEEADHNREAIVEQSLKIGNYFFFTPESFTYESMIASGDFKLIDEPAIKRYLIALHSQYDEIDQIQGNFIQALDEGFFPHILETFDYATFTPVSEDYHKSLKMRNFFIYTINDVSQQIKYYERARNTAQKLDSLIVMELH